MKLNLKNPFKTFSRGDLISVVSAITGVLSLAAIYHIAEKQEVFQRSGVEIAFEGAPPISTKEDTKIFVSVNRKLGESDKIYVPIEFDLKNSGDNELENVVLSFAFDKRGKHAEEPFGESTYAHHGMMITQNLQHEQSSTPDYDYSNFTILKLNVGDHPMIGEGIVAYSTPEPLPAYSPVFDLSDLGATIKIQLEADNIRKKAFSIDYRIVKLDNIDELTNWYVNYYAKATVIEKRTTMSTFAYLFRLIFSTEKQTAYLVAPEFRSILANGGTQWIPQKYDATLRAVTFQPYSWSLLFK